MSELFPQDDDIYEESPLRNPESFGSSQQNINPPQEQFKKLFNQPPAIEQVQVQQTLPPLPIAKPIQAPPLPIAKPKQIPPRTLQFNEELIDAVIQVESGGDPNARGKVGEVGLMQIKPDTAKQPGFDIKPFQGIDLFNPNANRKFGTRLLQGYIKLFNDDITLGLMAFNWGPKNVQKWIATGSDPKKIPKSVVNYVRDIKTIFGVE